MYLQRHKQFMVNDEVAAKLTTGESPLFEIEITPLPHDDKTIRRRYYEIGDTLVMTDMKIGDFPEWGSNQNSLYNTSKTGFDAIEDQIERMRRLNQESTGADLRFEADDSYSNESIDSLPFTIERDDP